MDIGKVGSKSINKIKNFPKSLIENTKKIIPIFKNKTNTYLNKDDDAYNLEEEQWMNGDFEEGQLSVDVYQTTRNIVIKSTIAGIKVEDIDIALNNDMLTIRGKREGNKKIKESDYLFKECYWGAFSRSIILPTEVKIDRIKADLENGILTIILPKAKTKKYIEVKVREK